MLVRARILGALALALVLATIGATQTPTTPASTLTPELKAEVMKEVNRIVTNVAFVPGVDFSKWQEFMEGEKETVEKAADARAFSQAVNAALRKFGISHIVMTTPEMAASRRTRTATGIGIQIQPEPGKGIRVINVFPESPAYEAGIREGDLIVEADGQKVDNPGQISGEEGSTVSVKYERDGKTKAVKVTRRKYSNVRPETLTWVNPDTALIKIWTFDVGYSQANVEKLFKEASKARNLILDLRSNPGGQVLNLVHLMSILLPERAPIGTFIQRPMVNRYVKETGGAATDLAAIAKFTDRPIRAGNPRIDRYKGNVAVLVNQGSGSASEIAAAALKENLSAPIVGAKSAGAVLVSVMNPLPHGFMIQYPITDFVTPNGTRLEGNGVEPIVEAPGLIRWGEKDVAVERATMLLARIDLRQDRDGGN
ncbi:MAG: PDZ domain-containing protein [Methanoregulaceae archaeon]|nr:PDZ domain-containing protein [Methanoregulaceae archaeon]